MKILVTGGLGSIGYVLVNKLKTICDVFFCDIGHFNESNYYRCDVSSINYKTYLRNINLTMFFILVESLEDGTVKIFMKICGEQML